MLNWCNYSQVIFMQIAVPSRTDVKEYQDLKEEMDQLVGKINGQFSTANWSPIRYIYGCISQVSTTNFKLNSSQSVNFGSKSKLTIE